MNNDNNFRCPSCGAAYTNKNTEKCEYCGTVFKNSAVSSKEILHTINNHQKTKNNKRPSQTNNNKNVKIILLFLVIIFVTIPIIFVTSAIFIGILSVETSDVIEDDKIAQPVEQSTDEELATGDNVEVVTINVTNVINDYKPTGTVLPTKENKYVKIEFTLIANDEITIDSSYFKLETDNSYYEQAIWFETNINSEELQRGTKKTYYVTYEIPREDNATTLIFEDMLNDILTFSIE